MSTELDKMLGLAARITEADQQPQFDPQKMLDLAEKVTENAQVIDYKLRDQFEWLGDIVGSDNIKQIFAGPRLNRITIRPPDSQTSKAIVDRMGQLFRRKNVKVDPKTGMISVAAGDEIAKSQFQQLQEELSGEIQKQAKGSISVGARTLAKTKLTPAGMKGNLEDEFGVGNVQPVPGDPSNFFVREKGQWKYFDEPEFTAKDISDIAPEAVETALGVGGALVGARFGRPIAGAAVGDVVASAARQGASAALPGKDFPTESTAEEIKERVKLGAINVAGGFVGEIPGKLAKLRPQRVLGEAVAKKAARGALPKRAALESRTGVDFSLGGKTGSQTIQRIEGMLREHPLVGDAMKKEDIRRIAQLSNFAEKTIEATSRGAIGSFDAANRIGKSYGMLVDELFRQRSKVAKEMFEKADNLAGGQKIIDLKNTMEIIDSIAEGAQASIRPQGAGDIAGFLLRQAEEVGGGKVSLPDMQRMLSLWRRAASGKQTVFSGLSPKEQATAAKRVLGALQRDLDGAVEVGGVPGAAGAALREARDSYRAMSEAIEGTKNTILEKATKLAETDAQEKLPGWILSTAATPRQIKNAMAIMKTGDPGAVEKVRGAVLDEMLDKAKEKAPAGGFALSPANLAASLRKHSKKIDALYGNDKKGRKAVRDLLDAAEVLRDQPGTGGSQTAPKQWMKKMWDALTLGGFAPQRVAAEAVQYFSAKKMAWIVNDPKKIAEFLQMVNPKPGKAVVVATNIWRAANRLAAMEKRQSILEEDF